MILAEITDSATPGKLDRHLEDRRKIADPRLIEDDDERQRLIDKAKMVVLLSCSIHATEVGQIVAISLLIAFLATIYPALKASQLQPVQAIRHE